MTKNFVAPSAAYLARLALPEFRRLQARAADYLAECEEYRREGYRPHYCQHGTDLWVDYDNICAGCEDGVDITDPMQQRRAALDDARVRYAQVTERLGWLGERPDSLPDSIQNAIVDWACQPIK